MATYVESKVRTSKLWCSDCRRKINKGERSVFALDGGKMEDVYCVKCGSVYQDEIDNDDTHPLSAEGLGQWCDEL